MQDKIKAALAAMDPANDDQWTGDGAPLVDIVSQAVGAKLTRADITNADPEFNREKAAARRAEASAESDAAKAAEEAEAQAAKEAEEAATRRAAEEQAQADAEAEDDFVPPIDFNHINYKKLFSSEENCTAMLNRITRELKSCSEAKKQVAAREQKLNALNELICRHLDRYRKDRGSSQADIQRAIQASIDSSRERAERARAAFGNLDPATVAKALDARSPIDRAMAQRPRQPRLLNPRQ